MAIPTALLIVYISFWALALRGGYQRDALQKQIRELQIQNEELETEKMRLREPIRVSSVAETKLGMISTVQTRYHPLQTRLTRLAAVPNSPDQENR